MAANQNVRWDHTSYMMSMQHAEWTPAETKAAQDAAGRMQAIAAPTDTWNSILRISLETQTG